MIVWQKKQKKQTVLVQNPAVQEEILEKETHCGPEVGIMLSKQISGDIDPDPLEDPDPDPLEDPDPFPLCDEQVI